MALAIAAVVALAVGPPVDARLIHPMFPPLTLLAHAALSTAWVLLLMVQTVLVYTGHIDWHRSLGVLAGALSAAMPFAGVATALAMVQAAAMRLHLSRPDAWLAIARGLLQMKWAQGLLLTVAVASMAAAATATAPGVAQRAWIASWAASPEAADPNDAEPLLRIDGQTVRQRIRVSVGGEQLRVRLSNEYGSTPLVIGSATVALPHDAASIEPRSLRSLTFARSRSVTIPPGAPVLSDPVDLSVVPGAEVSISLYFPEPVLTPTLHSLALKRAIITPRGDFTRADRIEAQAVSVSSILLSSVLVPARQGLRLVVAFGDSVTDGDASTLDADRGWPGDLARRLNKGGRNPGFAVVNEGIAGNRLLADGPGIKSLGISALARFDRDVLGLPGVTHVVLLEGLNDLGFPGATLDGRLLADPAETRTPEDLIGGYRQLIARAHVRGLKVLGATLMPFKGAALPGYYSDSKEAARQTVNNWIRSSGCFDAVIDFDAVVRDPSHPSQLRARFASSDHLHPNDDGYQAMADAVDEKMLQ